MKWVSVYEYLPGKFSGYVITRCLNSDDCDFYYMAIYTDGEWEFWDEQYWPKGRRTEGFRVTHWCIPDEVLDDE